MGPCEIYKFKLLRQPLKIICINFDFYLDIFRYSNSTFYTLGNIKFTYKNDIVAYTYVSYVGNAPNYISFGLRISKL